MAVVVLLVVIGTTVWAYVDAKGLEQSHQARVGNTAAGTWVLAMILLWIVAFPVYLVQRSSLTRLQPSRTPLAPEPTASVRYCPSCGTRLTADSRFCRSCGAMQPQPGSFSADR